MTRVYNGCGILVGADADRARRPTCTSPATHGSWATWPTCSSSRKSCRTTSSSSPSRKATRHGLKELKDLGKEGLRVGVGHEQQCALGAITKETFLKSGVYAAVRKNVKVESPTGDLLVNQLLTGSLDAVVCYVSNVTPNRDKLDAVPVTGIPCAAPEQPIAIARGSTKPGAGREVDRVPTVGRVAGAVREAGVRLGTRGPKK